MAEESANQEVERTENTAEGNNQQNTGTGTGSEANEGMLSQTQVNNLLKAERKKHEKKMVHVEKDLMTRLGIQSEEDIEKLHELRTRLDNEEKEKLEAKGKFDEILTRNEKKHQAEKLELEQRLSSINGEYDSYRKKVALTDMALKANADPGNIDMIVNFIEKDISISDGSFQVVDYDGHPRLDPDTGKEITLEAHIKNFLSQRPNLIKGAGTAGAGSSGSSGAAGMSMDKLRDLAVSDPAKYAELRADGTVQRVIDESRK